jgi:hypothetical protein
VSSPLYGKGGEFASNKLEDQEILMLSLHLLQVSLVYVNTLMIQQILAEPEWQNRLTEIDLRALSPLRWRHVNPYGTFTLNMQEIGEESSSTSVKTRPGLLPCGNNRQTPPEGPVRSGALY